MSHFSNKKHKKSPKPPQQHIALGIPTNIAVGPLGFRAELDVDPKGYLVMILLVGVDWPDPTVALDENPGPSRIVFRDKKRGKDQGLAVLETPAPGHDGVVIDGTKYGVEATSECS